jgi:hypothetical protein
MKLSQNTLSVVNGSGLAVRTAFNLAIQSVNTDFAGATDPATMVPSNAFAYMMWIDTANSLVKQRNTDNSAWVTLGKLDTDGTIKWDISKMNMAGTLGGALHQANPISLTSASGVLALTEEGNSFDVSGAEDLTSIIGWTAGRFTVKWTVARIVKNNANISIPTGLDRAILAGDISEFEFTAVGKVREINHSSSYAGAANIPQVGVPNNVVNGMEITAGTGLQAVVTTGRAIISEAAVNFDVFTNTITLSPRMTALIYAKLDKTISKVEAKLPDVDANTIVRYDFTNWDGVSPIPNSAVGVNGNTIAVANNLILTNPTPGTSLKRVDGHLGYAMQGDGSTGYGVSQNSTGFPLGANTRGMEVLYTHKVNGAVQIICSYGGNTPSTGYYLHVLSTNSLAIADNTTTFDSGFTLEDGKTYMIALYNDGLKSYLYVNGSFIYSVSQVPITIAGSLYIFRYQPSPSTYLSPSIIHAFELRNKIRTPAQIAQISNKLLLPCSYQTPSSPVPLMTANSSQGCVASASSEYAGYSAYMAFRKGSFTGDTGWYTATLATGWLQLQYPSAFKPKWVDIQAVNGDISRSPKDFTVYGSNDGGITKITLLTVVGATGWTANMRRRFAILGSSEYLTLGINITSVNGGALVSINDLDFGTDVVSTTDIREVLPSADCVSLGVVQTSSAGIKDINMKHKTGRREKAFGGNRKEFLGWVYFSGQSTIPLGFNPFDTRKVKYTLSYAEDANGTNETPVVANAYLNTDYGATIKGVDANGQIMCYISALGAAYLKGAWKTSGYIGCYAKIREDN